MGFLKSPVLSLRGRLRVLGEPFARGRPEGVDESIFDFASRRIGQEAASVLIDAMVSGVFAGNVHELSLASSFPKMAAMEAEHGGLVKAMVGRMKGRRVARREVEERRRRGEDVEDLVQPGGPAGPGGTLTSFRQGLDTLPIAAARELGDSVRYGVEVVSVGRGLEEGVEGAGGRREPGRRPWLHGWFGRPPGRRSPLTRWSSRLRHLGSAPFSRTVDGRSVPHRRSDSYRWAGRGGPGLRCGSHGWGTGGVRVSGSPGDRPQNSRVPLGLQHLPWPGAEREGPPSSHGRRCPRS